MGYGVPYGVGGRLLSGIGVWDTGPPMGFGGCPVGYGVPYGLWGFSVGSSVVYRDSPMGYGVPIWGIGGPL